MNKLKVDWPCYQAECNKTAVHMRKQFRSYEDKMMRIKSDRKLTVENCLNMRQVWQLWVKKSKD